MADFKPVLRCNWNLSDSHTLTVYESRRGHRAARTALTILDPGHVIEIIII